MTGGSELMAVVPEASREYLTFELGTEEYGVDILKVQEIRGYEAITSLPGLPPAIKGVINLRGVIVPVVDLRLRFGLTAPSYDGNTAMIVLDIGTRLIALVVDSVSEVVALQAGQIRPAPQFGAQIDTRFLAGLGTVGERMLILLDLNSLLGRDELSVMSWSLPRAA